MVTEFYETDIGLVQAVQSDRFESRTEPVTGKFERIGATWTVVFPSLSVHAC